MLSDLHPQDELLIAAALCQFSYRFETAEPELADCAWTIAAEIYADQGLNPGKAVLQLSSRIR